MFSLTTPLEDIQQLVVIPNINTVLELLPGQDPGICSSALRSLIGLLKCGKPQNYVIY